jgi:hypothetical protein
MTLELSNISLRYWCFEESIDKDTEFGGGNYLEKAKKEIIRILNYLKDNEQYDASIIPIDKLSIYIDYFTKICNSKTNFIDTFNKNKRKGRENGSFMAGWHKHTVLIFYKLNKTNNSYRVGIINCGEGAEYQGIYGDMCNGIYIFNNIAENNLETYLTEYTKWISNKITNREDGVVVYESFYLLIHKYLLKTINPGNNSPLLLSESANSKRFKLYSQIIGSCTFTNCINYIY